MSSLPRALPRVGRVGLRWEQWRKRQRALVALRMDGKCEGYRCAERATDWHHVFGRGKLVAEPLASHHTMTVGLCRTCHNASHRRERPLTPILELAALQRVCVWFRLPQVDDPREVRTVEAMLRAEGEWARLCLDAGR
jgi:hypothetical protein